MGVESKWRDSRQQKHADESGNTASDTEDEEVGRVHRQQKKRIRNLKKAKNKNKQLNIA